MKTYKEIKDYVEDMTDELVLLFNNYDYATAFVGLTIDNRALYDYNKMIYFLVDTEEMSYFEAMEWIDYNTTRSLGYGDLPSPIIINLV